MSANPKSLIDDLQKLLADPDKSEDHVAAVAVAALTEGGNSPAELLADIDQSRLQEIRTMAEQAASGLRDNLQNLHTQRSASSDQDLVSQVADLLRPLVAEQLEREVAGQLVPPPLPDSAPERWKDRDSARSENPVQFIRRVYAPWVGNGLTRPDLARLDPPLYKALGVWSHRHPDDTLPEVITLSQKIDQMVDELSDKYSPDELRKLGLALQARARKDMKPKH